MEYELLLEKYKEQLNALKEIIIASKNRVLADPPDELFSNNVNFFVKSYLINICTYLEAYLQDVAFEHTKRISNRLTQANIPHNFLYWKLSKDVKEKDLDFKAADYAVDKKEISDLISGNPYKSIKAFKLIGINLQESEKFTEHKDLVNTVVVKRNNIIHHNDEASDITFNDLISNIDTFIEYMESINNLVEGAE